MDQKLLREREAQCIQENPPGCSAACPVHVDVRGMVEAIRKGEYAAGFALFHKAVPFPRILCRICDQPCQGSCKRKEVDESISINALERICTDRNDKVVAQPLAIPQSSKKVAIVGAGLSGMTAAVELTRKGFAVTVFEAEGRLGGSIWSIPASRLPADEIAQDLSFFDKLNLIINLNMPIGGSESTGRTLADLCGEYDAVYISTGCGGNAASAWGLAKDSSGRVAIEPDTLETGIPKVFAGGSLRLGYEKRSPILSVADGKKAANSIERFMQGASLSANREKEGAFKTALYTNIAGIKPEPAVTCADPAGGFTTDEARREAGRCLLCECRECVKVCEYMTHYGAYPKRYVREVYNNLSIVMGMHHSNKMINTCSLCGLCEEVCPQKLDMGEVCLEARQMMVQRGKMPPSTHDFALRDMRFSNSDQFLLSRHQRGFSSSKFVFFPGCQHAAASPQNVQKIYEFLCDKMDGGVALMLGCCGAPAYWSGQEELFRETLQGFESNWRDLGSPQVITACPTCFSMFRNNAPNMQVEMLWTLLDRIGLPTRKGFHSEPRKLAVHDSCSTRHEVALQNSVRSLLTKLGHEIEELPASHEHTVCCGYGGLMIFADKEVAKKVIDRRIHESETDYLAYCAMCRDNFASRGKRAFYLLDLLFEADAEYPAVQESPGYSQRQENRGRLKRNVLREIWGEIVEEPQAEIKVVIPENVQKIMDERMILVEDVTKVIAHAEMTGDKLKLGENGHFLACFQPLRVTYWVEYSPRKEGFLLHNTYSHRIEILK